MQDSNSTFNISGQRIKAFIDHVAANDPALSRMLRALLLRENSASNDIKNVFAKPSAQDFEELRKLYPQLVNNSETLAWPVVNSDFAADMYVPIRGFRSDPARIWPSVDKLRIFLSSGTTSGPEGRSKSGYTPEGLAFYRAGSIAAFLGVLEHRVLPFSGDILNTVSVSLVPTVEKWPDSSLAQMVSWFADIWPTEYADSENINDVRRAIDRAAAKNCPLFLFGTAFHFVNLLDGGAAFTLPKGSVIIETGGTKGRSRSVTRSELYEMIAHGFGVSESDIISEYGMCELASQAWDVLPIGETRSLSQRTFRFPWWVSCGVMTCPSVAQTIGEGALTILDPLRVDIGSARKQIALQTEDLANINDDGSITLLGRVPRAPLKGCSLKVDDIKTEGEGLHRTNSKSTDTVITYDKKIFSSNAPKVRRWFLDVLSDREALKRLTAEFQSKTLAREAILDLSSGLPFDADGFATAAKNP